MSLFLRITEKLGNRLKKTWFAGYWVGKVIIDLIYLPSDIAKVKKHYRIEAGEKLYLLKPKSFNHFLQYSKLFWRKKQHIILADKVKCRDFVKEKIGEDYLSKMLWTGNSFDDIELDKLPDSFVIKTNHASGTNMIIRNKSDFEKETAQKKFNKWLLIDYAQFFVEWQYRWIYPEILVEELLVDQNDDIPADYKFFCFWGKVQFVQIDLDRFLNHTRIYVDRQFNILPFSIKYPQAPQRPAKPDSFYEMIDLAEKLAENERFVRVDFYLLEKPIFSEMTFHPEAGTGKFSPSEWDLRLGKLFKKGYNLNDLI